MIIQKAISNEPITQFKRIVHYAGLEDCPALFQPNNIPTILTKFICEYYTNTDHLIKRTVFGFQIDNQTRVNPATGVFDENGIGEKDFFDYIMSQPVVLSSVIDNYISILDSRGDFNETNFIKRLIKPYPFSI